MLDYRFIVDNLAAVKQNIAERFLRADADLTASLYNRRNALMTEIQGLQQKRNVNAQAMKGAGKLEAAERTALVDEGKRLKEDIALKETELTQVEAGLLTEARRIPNMAHPDAPRGKEDKNNLEVKRVGTPRQFDFPPRDHVRLGQELDIIDFDRATKVSGVKFYYLKNEGVFLELGLVRYALDILQKKRVYAVYYAGCCPRRNPRGAESNVYTIEGEGTCLVGTAEITLGGYHADTVIPREKLPLKMAGLSHCFRREAGAAGQFSKGLYRVHQFTKVEMFVYCLPEDSSRIHEELRGIEEEIFSGLEIPFRVVDTCTGDLGAPAYRKWDLEAWMPGRGQPDGGAGEWGEVTSTSNCTDYQARRLGVRYRDEDGKNKFVHMLNGTAVAVSRAIVAILENFQQADGSVVIPRALVPYCGFEKIAPRINHIRE